VAEDVTFLAPVDLGLRPRDDLEAAVQPAQGAASRPIEFSLQDRPNGREVHLHALVVAGETMLSDQTLVDHTHPQPDVGAEPGLDQQDERSDHLRLTARP